MSIPMKGMVSQRKSSRAGVRELLSQYDNDLILATRPHLGTPVPSFSGWRVHPIGSLPLFIL